MIQKWDALKVTLNGEKLIEASAGTGKTYTISTIYLRLLLQHHTHNLPYLTVENILVVTFTEAASAELRDRIRNKIREAKKDFLRGQSDNPELQSILNDFPNHNEQYTILDKNEKLMDEAAIFTIHGFAHRMLNQYAFECGNNFDITLEEDVSELLNLSIEDFWRYHIYPLPALLYQEILSCWATPYTLLKNIRTALKHYDYCDIYHNHLPDIKTLHTQKERILQTIKAHWKQHFVTTGIAYFTVLHKDAFCSAFLKGCEKPFHLISDWVDNPYTTDLPSSVLKALKKFTLSYITRNLKKSYLKKTNQQGLQAPHFDTLEQLLSLPSIDIANNYSDYLKQRIFCDAVEFCQHKFKDLKKQHNIIEFNDLLSQLKQSLEGQYGQQLAKKIRHQYPVAMIDEFQDTDTIQYAIFSILYRQQNNTAWLLIGDPKQAIYAFRGADIFTYMQAQGKIQQHYSLPINWRSSRAMIHAINHFFQHYYEWETETFIASEDVFYYNAIPFIPVSAPEHTTEVEKSPLLIEGKNPPALSCFFQPGEPTSSAQNKSEHIERGISNNDYLYTMAKATAQQIYHLLELAKKGQACIGDRAINNKDCAILVRTKKQAGFIKKALLQYGIKSVYLSDRSNVFSTQEAKDILHLLSACLDPTDHTKLFTALSVPTLKMSFEQLKQLQEDDIQHEALILQFQKYQALWLQKSVLVMLHRLFFDFNIAQQLHLSEYTERHLTDLLHIAELLQTASQYLDGGRALWQWLEEKIENSKEDNKSQQMRLESEHNLIPILTIHKAKGLQFNLVFLPFICSVSPTQKSNPQPYYHYHNSTYNDHGDIQSTTFIIDIRTENTIQQEAKEKQQQETIAEEVRLLYVAMTRSIYQCYIGVGACREKKQYSQVHLSALGYLLSRGKPIQQLLPPFEALEKAHLIQLQHLPLVHKNTTFIPENESLPPSSLEAKVFQRQLNNNWWISSFTSLSKKTQHDAHTELPGVTDEMPADEDEDISTITIPVDIPKDTDNLSFFDFPKGATAGNFLHTLLEIIDFTDPQRWMEQITALRSQYQYDPQWDIVLFTALQNITHTPLNNTALCLQHIAYTHKIVEMEFYLPMQPCNAKQLNPIIQQHDRLSQQAHAVTFHTLQGMLTGFIDLFFEYQGKYYLLDYKSNYLGHYYSDYHPRLLQQAMIQHRYDLQYQFYTLAVHRFLKIRKKHHYHYEKHFGGVFYLFLRGMQGDTSNNTTGVFFTRPTYALIQKLDQYFGNDYDNT